MDGKVETNAGGKGEFRELETKRPPAQREEVMVVEEEDGAGGRKRETFTAAGKMERWKSLWGRITHGPY